MAALDNLSGAWDMFIQPYWQRVVKSVMRFRMVTVQFERLWAL